MTNKIILGKGMLGARFQKDLGRQAQTLRFILLSVWLVSEGVNLGLGFRKRILPSGWTGPGRRKTFRQETNSDMGSFAAPDGNEIFQKYGSLGDNFCRSGFLAKVLPCWE